MEIWNRCHLLSKMSIRLDKLLVTHYLWSNKMPFSTQATPITFPGDHLHNLAFPVFIQPINHTTQFQIVAFKSISSGALSWNPPPKSSRGHIGTAHMRVHPSTFDVFTHVGFYQRHRAHARTSGYISICLEIFSPYAVILIHQIKDLSSLPYILPPFWLLAQQFIITWCHNDVLRNKSCSTNFYYASFMTLWTLL